MSGETGRSSLRTAAAVFSVYAISLLGEAAYVAGSPSGDPWAGQHPGQQQRDAADEGRLEVRCGITVSCSAAGCPRD